MLKDVHPVEIRSVEQHRQSFGGIFGDDGHFLLEETNGKIISELGGVGVPQDPAPQKPQQDPKAIFEQAHWKERGIRSNSGRRYGNHWRATGGFAAMGWAALPGGIAGAFVGGTFGAAGGVIMGGLTEPFWRLKYDYWTYGPALNRAVIDCERGSEYGR